MIFKSTLTTTRRTQRARPPRGVSRSPTNNRRRRWSTKVHPRPTSTEGPLRCCGGRPQSRPEAGSAPRPRPGRCPTRTPVVATRHRRHRQPPRRVQRRDAKAAHPRRASPRCQHPCHGLSRTASERRRSVSRSPPRICRAGCNLPQMGRGAFRSALEGVTREEGRSWLNGSCSSSSASVRAAPSPLCMRGISNN